MSAISNAFQVMVVFSAVDHLTGPMQRMAGQMGLCSQQTEELQNRLNRFKNMMFVGGGITAIGAVMAKGLQHAVDAAGELQSSLMGVRQSLGLTVSQFRNLQNVVMTEGIPTAFSAVQMGQLTEGMVGGGMGKTVTAALDPNSVARKVLREYIAYADVRYLGAYHENPRESVATASQMAHSYGVYDAEGTRKFLNTLNAALASYHGTSSEFNTQFGYYSGTAKTVGMSMPDAIMTEAFMGRLGLGAGRGGTNINQFLQRTLPNGQKKHDRAMQEAGFLDKKGHSVFFDGNTFAGWERASAVLQKFNKNFTDIAVKNRLLTAVFSEFGKRVAFKVMDKGSMEQLHNVRSEMSKVASITAQQEERNKSWEGQMKQLSSVIHDVVIQFGLGLMPIAQKFADKLNEIAAAVLEWTIHNPKIVEMAASFTLAATAVALVVGPLMLIHGALGWLFASGMIVTGIRLVGSAFVAAMGPMLAFAAVAAVVYATTIRNNQDILHAITNTSDHVGKVWTEHHKLMMKVASGEDINTNSFWQSISESAKECTNNIYASFQWLAENIPKALDAISNTFKTWVGYTNELLQNMKNLGWVNGPTTSQLDNAFAYAARNGKPGSGNIPVNSVQNEGVPGAQIHAVPKQNFFQRNFGHMFGYAGGTDFARGGWSMVGERGPELVNLPRGSQVIPNHRLGGGVSVGDIHVHGAPGQSEEAIADAVMRRLRQELRNRSYASPDAVLSSW